MTIALSGITAWSGYPSYNLSVCFADSSPSRGASGEEEKFSAMPRPPLVRSNNDDRRQWQKQGVAVGAAASKTQAKRCGCWVPQPGQRHGVSRDGEVYQRMSLTDTACYFKNLWTARATMPPRMPETRNSATPCTPTSRTTNIRGLAAPLTDTRFWT